MGNKDRGNREKKKPKKTKIVPTNVSQPVRRPVFQPPVPVVKEPTPGSSI
jgi:hypothetical protein